MTYRPGIVERAYQVANSGNVATVTLLKRQLRAEGYVSIEAYLAGGVLHAALRRACLDACKGTAANASAVSAPG
jgi:hypothetical protein